MFINYETYFLKITIKNGAYLEIAKVHHRAGQARCRSGKFCMIVTSINIASAKLRGSSGENMVAAFIVFEPRVIVNIAVLSCQRSSGHNKGPQELEALPLQTLLWEQDYLFFIFAIYISQLM